MAGNSAECGRSVTSKVIAILLVFTQGSTHTLTETARLARLPVSTVYRLAGELTAWGVLERTEDGLYRIGNRLAGLNGRAPGLPQPNSSERARRIMEDLAAASGTADVRLGVLADHEVVFLRKPPGGRPVATSVDPAGLPAHATAMGKALLAFAPANVIDMLIARGLKRYTEYTLTTSEGLRRALTITRLTGVAVARREFDLNALAVAAPVFGAGGEVVAALELQDHYRQDVRLMSPPLIVAARCMSRELLTPYALTQLRSGIVSAVG
jgi:DNA-binding IclR family transcriptional regulator